MDKQTQHRCDECGTALSTLEIQRNLVENTEENGNSFWCNACTDVRRAEADDQEIDDDD